MNRTFSETPAAGWRTLPPAACLLVMLGVIFFAHRVMSRTGWPGLHGDALLYSTVSINLADHRDTTFAVYTPLLLKLGGKTEFRSHGQLYEGLLGALGTIDYRAYLDRVFDINIVTILAFAAWLMWLCIREARLSLWAAVAISALGSGALSSVLLYLQGRPEQIIPLILIGGSVARSCSRGWLAKSLCDGVELGLVGACSPLPGVVLTSWHMVRLSLQPGFIGPAKSLAMIVVSALIAWAAATRAVYAHSLVELARSTLQAGQSGPPQARRQLIYGWLLQLSLPGMLLPFLAVSFLLARKIILLPFEFKTFPKLLLVAVCSMNFGLWVYRGGFVTPWVFYNLVCFLPMTFFQIPLLTRDSEEGSSRRWFGLGLAILLVGGFAISLGTVRAYVLARLCERTGASLTDVRGRFAEITRGMAPDERILLDPYAGEFNPIVLDGPDWRFLTLPDHRDLVPDIEKLLRVKGTYLMVLQTNPDGVVPKPAGHALMFESFRPGVPRLLGFPLAPCMPGYRFALYRKL